jgi:hypothetical protein
MSAPDATATPQPHNRDGVPAEPAAACAAAHSIPAEQLRR